MVRDDLLGVCKFAGLNTDAATQCLVDEIGLQITKQELLAAVRRAFIHALWLERKQGYERDDYTMPAQVFDSPNPAIEAEGFVTREFFAALSDRVWEVFDQEIAGLGL